MNRELFMKLLSLPNDPFDMALYAATASVVKRSVNNPSLRGSSPRHSCSRHTPRLPFDGIDKPRAVYCTAFFGPRHAFGISCR